MADNTILNPGTGGDTIRTIQRPTLGGVVKTQVVQIDIGGPEADAELLMNSGVQTTANSAAVAIASDQSPIPVSNPLQGVLNVLQLQTMLVQQGSSVNGFIPIETPSFLVGG